MFLKEAGTRNRAPSPFFRPIFPILERPEKTENDKTDPKLTHALGRISEHGNRVLRVVYNPVIDPITVVTAYFDRAMRNKL